MSTHTELVIWKLASSTGHRPSESFFSSREIAEREKSLIRHSYGNHAYARVTPVRVMRQAEAVR